VRIALLYESKPKSLPEGAPLDLYMELENIEDIERLSNAIEQLEHTVLLVNTLEDPLTRLLQIKDRIDLVFNYSVGFGTRSREIIGAALCELLKVPYTGSDALALALASSKPTTKLNARDAGISTPDWHLLENVADLGPVIDQLQYPVVVKPAFEGSSIGVCGPIDHQDVEAVRGAVLEVSGTYAQPVLVERFIPGFEVTVPVLGTPPLAVTPMALSVKDTFEFNSIFGAALKSEREGHRWVAEFPLAQEVRNQASEWACRIHERLGCRDFSRSDFRITPEGEVYFLEINPTSQLTDSFTAAAEARSRDLLWVLHEIIEGARVRWGL
jgi:D-alanine-D-alanine ligase